MYLISVYSLAGRKWSYYLFDSKNECLHWYREYQKQKGLLLVRAYKLLEGDLC